MLAIKYAQRNQRDHRGSIWGRNWWVERRRVQVLLIAYGLHASCVLAVVHCFVGNNCTSHC